MNVKISIFIICVEVIIYLLLYHLHDYNFSIYVDLPQIFTITLRKMKFNKKEPMGLVTFTDETRTGKIYFFSSGFAYIFMPNL